MRHFIGRNIRTPEKFRHEVVGDNIKQSKLLINRVNEQKKENNIPRDCPYMIRKEDQLLYIIRKFQQILIETVKIRFEQPILNDSILLEL